MADSGLVLLDGANQLSSLRALWWVARNARRFRAEMLSAPGYVAHRVWFLPPLTVGLTTWWADERSAYKFAHMPEHLRFWSWAASGNKTQGGWLAIYRHAHGGPLWGNGVESMMSRFGRFVGEADDQPPRPIPAQRQPDDQP